MELIVKDTEHGESVDIRNASINGLRTGSRGKIRDFSIVFGGPKKPVIIGDDFFIGTHCYLNGVAGLTIGSRVTIAHGAMIFTDSGPNTSPLLQKRFPIEFKPVKIGDDVWIGAGAMILPGVTIGSKCVIGAGSLVKEDVPDGSIVAGSPAKVIGAV
jgi:acetyltransferase-like isoleucine patch superfamily enzyme